MGNLLNKSDSSSLQYKSPVNNAIMDPFQGFDADVFVLDQGTGNLNLVGRFASIQLTIRNATEPYLELNQRVPRLLDGELQFGFVLERGMLDVRVLEQTFGYTAMTRELRNNRNTRFQITFNVHAGELSNYDGGTFKANGGTTGGGLVNTTDLGITRNAVSKTSSNFNERKAKGRLVLTYCKVETLTIGANAGRAVIANKWDGMAEGIEFVDSSNINAGTYLRSAVADQALKVGATKEKVKDGAFPWDDKLYSRNRDGNDKRNTNPLPKA